MGKSTKKSASKVAVAAPASPPASPPAKSLKKGKREAEVVIENELVSAKKQKSLKKRESEQKPVKPDSESHSDISEVAAKYETTPPPSNGRSAKKAKKSKSTKKAKKAEEEIEDEEVQEEKRGEPEQKPVKPDSESHSDISEVAAKNETTPPPSNGRSAKKAKKSKSAKKAKKAEEEIEDEEVQEEKRGEPEQKPVKPDSESHSDISEVAAKNETTPPPSNARSAKKSKKAKSAKKAKKAEEEIEDEEVQEEKMKASPEKSSPAPMIPKTNEIDATPKEQSTGGGGSKTLLVRNMPYDVQKEDILEFFKPAGQVVDVRLDLGKLGNKFKGSGNVDLATAEQAKRAFLELNGEEMLGRPVRLEVVKEAELGEGNTLFVKQISVQAQKEDILEFFKPAGEVVDIRLAMRKGDSFKGYGRVDYATVEEAEKALQELNGKRLKGRIVSLSREETMGEGKTLIFKNLFFQIQKEEVVEFFKTAGEVVDVRLAMRIGDSFKGYAHVDFATREQALKALAELDGKVLLDREVKLIIAREPQKKEWRRPFERKPNLEVFVTGFDSHVGEDNIRASLTDHFACCGEIARITVPSGKWGKPAGLAYIQFVNEDARNKALGLGTETMVVMVPRPRVADSNSDGTGANTTTVGDD